MSILTTRSRFRMPTCACSSFRPIGNAFPLGHGSVACGPMLSHRQARAHYGRVFELIQLQFNEAAEWWKSQARFQFAQRIPLPELQ